MFKGEIIKSLVDDLSLDDLEKELDPENSVKSHLQSGSGKEIYSVKHKYGALSETKNAPLFTLTDWGGNIRYDLRKWTENGEPGKGITLTNDELEKLYAALCKFDFDKLYNSAIRRRKIKNSIVTFYHQIAELSTSPANNLIWRKEVNLIDWGVGTRVDFRKWANDYLQPGKGIRISLDELKVLRRMINDIMMDDIWDISLDEIVDADNEDEAKIDRLNEIKRYEKLYLLKTQLDNEVDPTDIPDEKKLSLYDGIIFSGFKRYYKEDLTERDYRLESTTPYQIVMGTTVLEDGAWGDMICKVVSYLLDQYPEKRADIESFRCPWTKTAMFSTTKKTNFKCLGDGLYVNCNHTALHSCWFIQDIMDYFGIEKSEVKMLIHRPCIAEPQELKQHIERTFKRGFKKYITVQYEKSDDYAEKVVRNIEKYLNPMLGNISKSYPNFFLFDDATIASGYIKKVKEIIEGNGRYDDRTKKVLYKYLHFLSGYYKL